MCKVIYIKEKNVMYMHVIVNVDIVCQHSLKQLDKFSIIIKCRHSWLLTKNKDRKFEDNNH